MVKFNAQYKELSLIQQTAISDAENAIKKAFNGQKKFIIFSAVVVALTLLGIISNTIQVLNLFVQPFLFIIPAIPALRGIFKARSAVDKVSSDYLNYYKLRDRQQKAAMGIFILLADIFAYLGNFVLIIIMHT